MGDLEALALASVESLLKYHPAYFGALTSARYPGQGQRQAGSLTGAVSSQKVTEESKASLIVVGNHELSVKI